MIRADVTQVSPLLVQPRGAVTGQPPSRVWGPVAGLEVGDELRCEVVDGQLEVYVVPVDSGWVAPTFENGWTDLGTDYAAGYRRVGGVVWLRGLVVPGSIGGFGTSPAMLTLPAGFRPAHLEAFTTGCANATTSVYSSAMVQVFADGKVSCRGANTGGAGSWVSLSGISFVAEG